MSEKSASKDKNNAAPAPKRPERQAAKLVTAKKERKTRFGPNRKPRSVMFDAISIEAYTHLDQAFPGGFNLTRWFNRAIQAEAERFGWTRPEQNQE